MAATEGRPTSDPRVVTDAIRAAILSAEFAPGQRLVEADLSEQFRASRSAVRAALFSLATEGLVERIANRGARVRVVSLEEATEIYEVRMVVEALCAAKAAERIDDADVAMLQQIGTEMRAAVTSGDVFGYSALNQRLHRALRDLSGQKTAADVLDRLRGQLVRHQFRLATQPGRPQVSLDEHLQIIDAVCARDPDAAAIAVRRHLESVMAAMRKAAEATAAAV
ncbi:GntR family transcriptional regulator [Mumia sp. zg.B53]|uniref:GntR family transcriptional regulator n=1 Tax=unclassified Mumia TaxID=2621872 RepID=UPI001C6E1327|nr:MULTISPECIES: GntR family transcriptional regulator [unclassified Mumia]MBW9205804.1 GntR family transcriptional regulator [Mumia sp. zg.B17]MBW9208192.1 GntR family transcriptional regulator [Mumia sp. zg.B21]MBW9216147.1 GntR family transcriptional regulator [Mumia sp. zg.B53]